MKTKKVGRDGATDDIISVPFGISEIDSSRNLYFSAACGVARQDIEGDFGHYKMHVDICWFYSNPSGVLQGSSDAAPVDIQKDLGFDTYSTFARKVDWKINHKNHFFLVVIPFDASNQVVLKRPLYVRRTDLQR